MSRPILKQTALPTWDVPHPNSLHAAKQTAHAQVSAERLRGNSVGLRQHQGKYLSLVHHIHFRYSGHVLGFDLFGPLAVHHLPNEIQKHERSLSIGQLQVIFAVANFGETSNP